jgi:hypothetical protein
MRKGYPHCGYMAAHMKGYVEEMERLIPNCPAAETDFSGKQQMIMKMN